MAKTKKSCFPLGTGDYLLCLAPVHVVFITLIKLRPAAPPQLWTEVRVTLRSGSGVPIRDASPDPYNNPS